MGSTTYCICDLLGSMDGLIIYSPHEPPPTVRYARHFAYFHATLHDVVAEFTLHWFNSCQEVSYFSWSTESDWSSCSTGQRPEAVYTFSSAVSI